MACNPRYHPNDATLASTPPMPPTLARNPRHPRKPATQVTHANTPPTPSTLAHHPRYPR